MPLENTITNLNLVLVGLIVAESAFVPTQIQDGFCCHLFCLLSRKVPNAAGSLKRSQMCTIGKKLFLRLKGSADQ